ncbi:MAG: histidine phosphatase family protein [Candidatus Sumerlaeaceae bacterium]|nr:histidine phosphatase family protein [Candidatus Sumerlaeaceae bacterium]
MKIVFVRHAEAEEKGQGIPGADEHRKLTKSGQREARAVGRVLNSLKMRPAMIFTSPLVRARQTAEILQGQIKRSPDPCDTRALAPEGTWVDLQREIARHGDLFAGKNPDKIVVFAVGHQPNLGRMITDALAGRNSGCILQKGACVALAWKDDKPQGAAEILFALTPDQAAVLA